MNNVNFIKNIDNLGRIVIPMDIRRKLQINTGDVLSITCNDKNIMLTKYSSLDNNPKVVGILKCFIEDFNIKAILTNKECVLYSNLVNIGAKLDSNTKLLVKNGTNIRNNSSTSYFGDRKIEGIYNMLPIVTMGQPTHLNQLHMVTSSAVGLWRASTMSTPRSMRPEDWK